MHCGVFTRQGGPLAALSVWVASGKKLDLRLSFRVSFCDFSIVTSKVMSVPPCQGTFEMHCTSI